MTQMIQLLDETDRQRRSDTNSRLAAMVASFSMNR
mgnify:CR=1 FL=1